MTGLDDGLGLERLSPQHGVRQVSPRELAEDLAREAEAKGVQLVRRPWNRFAPDETDWWLIPTSDWPAHRANKLQIKWVSEAQTRLLVGLHVEKGLGQEIQAVYDAPKGRRLIMDDSWAWWNLLADLEGGRIRRAASCLVDGGLAPLGLHMEGGYVADPDSFDPYVYDFEQDRFTYRVAAGGRLELLEASQPAGLLGSLETVRELADLVTPLRSLTQNSWLWIDFQLAVPLVAGADPFGELKLQTEDWLWQRIAEGFEPWLVGPEAGEH